MKGRRLLPIALLLALAPDLAVGQSIGQGTGPGDGVAARRRERIAQEGTAPRRQQLEQALRTGVARVVRQRIGLSDEQMSKLARSDARFAARRRDLVREERLRRVELRRQILAGEGADQDRVATALDQLLALQRRRIDLQIEEQRELATFMSPIQRAKYVALQEQLRRRVEGIRTGRPGPGGGGS
jgi:hypothetical protein